MNMKRILCTALSATMLCSVALAAETAAVQPMPILVAQEDAAVTNPSFTLVQSHALPIMVYGTAALSENKIVLSTENEHAPYQQIILGVDENSLILDAATGARKAFSDLKEGETLYAYAGPIMTMSIPPQSYANIVLCNIPMDFMVPQYVQVEQVITGEDGKISLLTSNDLVMHMDENVTYLSADGESEVSLADIKPGTNLLSWYSLVAESFPGQTTPSQVMVFPYEYAAWTAMDLSGVTVDGKAVELSEQELPYSQDGHLLVPVRKLAEALGCQVTWSADAPSQVAVSKDGKILYSLDLSGDTVVVDGDMILSLTQAPQVKGGVTFLSAEDLLSLHALKLEGPWPGLDILE